MRNNMRKFGKTNPLTKADFDEFIKLYKRDDMNKREETYSTDNPNARWRKFTIDEFKQRPNFNIDISWIQEVDDRPDYSIEEMIEILTEKRDSIKI